jgi:hypothetical protein
MKRRIACSALLMALAVWAFSQAQAPKSLAGYVPAGPLLYLESGDFGALVRDWNASAEKKLWLESASFQVFSRSRLYQRLADAQKEFAAAAGFPADMPLVESIAGGESALAVYNIGKLEFFYITRLETARAVETVLWRTRGSYETRNAAGTNYFVRTDPASRRTAAFAATNDYLLLATREDLIPAALKLLAGETGAAVTDEEWFAAPQRETGARGDLRMVMNLKALVRSPHFRSYWVQRNVSELRQFGAGIADVFRSPSGIREERVLLRFGEAPLAATSDALAQALRLAPEDSGMYRAWANPSSEAALDLLTSRVLEPQPLGGRKSETAPAAPVSAIAGSEGDLETRIDEPPLPDTGDHFAPAELRRLLENTKLEAMLEVGSTRTLTDGVFVGIDSAVALLASTDWNVAAVREALATAAETGPLGRISVEARGRVLIIANSAPLAGAIAARVPRSPAHAGGSYAAGFVAARERGNFEKLTSMVDFATMPEAFDRRTTREPRFFSENIASLGRVLGRVESSSIVVRDGGRAVTQTVTYRFAE